MKNLTWQNPEQLFVAQELINKVKSKCCGIKDIEKYFSVQRDDDVINNVRNRVAVYEDSIRRHHEMVEMAAYKDSLAKQLNKEANDIKERLKK